MLSGSQTLFYDYVDGATVTGKILSVSVPVEQRFRYLWVYYQAATFTTGAQTDIVVYSPGGGEMLRLPAFHQPKTGLNLGCAVSTITSLALSTIINSARTSGFQFFYSVAANNFIYWLNPIPLLDTVTNRIELQTTNPAVVTSAFLAVHSSSSPLIQAA